MQKCYAILVVLITAQLTNAYEGCAVFGQNIDDENAISQTVYFPECSNLISQSADGISINISYGIWATTLDSWGNHQIAVFSQNNSAPGVSSPQAGWMSLWTPEPDKNNGGSDTIETMALGECTEPVGARYDSVAQPSKLYVACFGDDQNNGLLVVDLTAINGKIEVAEFSFYGYPNNQGDGVHHVHNVYIFNDEVYVAILGEPWGTTAGHGLVRFDMDTETFDSPTMELNARSAAQSLLNESVVYVLTQYNAEYSTLNRLALQPDKSFVVQTSVALTEGNFTNGVEGGGDVFVSIADDKEYIWATDRLNNNYGQLYSFLIEEDSNVFLKQTVRPTGIQPRYTTMFANDNSEDSIITSNEAGADLSYFADLGNHPSDTSIEASPISNPIEGSPPLMFFIGDI